MKKIVNFEEQLDRLEKLRYISTPESRKRRRAKTEIVVKWYNKLQKEGRGLELPTGTLDILLVRANELVRALEEEADYAGI